MKISFTKMVAVLTGLMCAVPALAEDNSDITLKCKITQCAPQGDCQFRFGLGDSKFAATAGAEFIFNLTDNWKITADEFRLDHLRFPGETYMSRTVVNMTINRASNAMVMGLKVAGSGVESHEAQASGTCEIIHAQSLAF